MKIRFDREERKGISKFFYMMKLRWKFGFIPSFYDIKWGVKNLRRWFKTIWNYRDWDGNYTIDVLIKSLEFQRDRLKYFSYEVDESLQPKIDRIEKTIYLLKRSQDESIYTDPIYKYYDEKYGEDEMYFVPIDKTYNGEKLSEMRTSRQDELEPEEYEAYRREKYKKLRSAERARLRDRETAFRIIHKSIDRWWE